MSGIRSPNRRSRFSSWDTATHGPEPHPDWVVTEFVGEPDGAAAPRLAQCRPSAAEAAELFEQCREAMLVFAGAGWAHGDLSAYNMLVHRGRLVLIDLPQVVDVVANPRGQDFLYRDCVNVCRWFTTRGVDSADHERLFGDLIAEAVGCL